MGQAIDETQPSLTEVRETVRKLRIEKAAVICNYGAVTLKAGNEGMIQRLHAGLSTVLQSDTISPHLKSALVVTLWKREKGPAMTATSSVILYLLSVPDKMFVYMLLMQI